MSVLRNLFTPAKPSGAVSGGSETAPVKMDLNERMAFRREMLYEAIRVTMEAHGILSASYRFRVVRNDRRGHMYSLMMDLSTDFMHKREGRPAQLAALGAAIATTAAARYGILVTGAYWRVNEEMRGFESSQPVAGPRDDAPAADKAAPARQHGRDRAEALAAFEAARQEGGELRFRERVYASDLAPLGR